MSDVTGCCSNTSSIRHVRFYLSRYDGKLLTTDHIVTLPLWSPSVVEIGAVGYLRKPEGGFLTLFNAFDPPKSSDGLLKGMANLHGYGDISEGNYQQDVRNRALRGLDVLQGWISSKLYPFVDSPDGIQFVSQPGVGITLADGIHSI